MGQYGKSAMENVKAFLEQWHAQTPYIETHTSGSTGKPKDIRLLKSDMTASAAATNAFFGIDNKSILASPLSVDYIAGKMMIVRALIADCRFIQLPVSNCITLAADVQRVDLLPVVPTQLKSLISQPELSQRIGNVLIGGAPPSADDCRHLISTGYRAFISYGMTETCSHVALADAADPERIFHAMPGISFDVDADNRLIINAPHFSYRQITANDIVELLSATSFRWRSRADDAINSGGIKMYAPEIEALYAEALTGRTYYVRGDSDGRWGQAITLVIEGLPGEEKAIYALLRRTIADHRRLPKKIIAVSSIPRTTNGKIKRI